jgi:hypothetical protein
MWLEISAVFLTAYFKVSGYSSVKLAKTGKRNSGKLVH